MKSRTLGLVLSLFITQPSVVFAGDLATTTGLYTPKEAEPIIFEYKGTDETNYTALDQVIVFEYQPLDVDGINYTPIDQEVIVYEYKGTESKAGFSLNFTPSDQVIVFEYKGLDADVLVDSYHADTGETVRLRALNNGLVALEIGGKEVMRMAPVCEACSK